MQHHVGATHVVETADGVVVHAWAVQEIDFAFLQDVSGHVLEHARGVARTA
jgi:hypothetical protein